VSKTQKAAIHLSKQLQNKASYDNGIIKEYRALVVGNAMEKFAVGETIAIDAPIDSKPSLTDVKVLGFTTCPSDGLLTDLQLFARTGRRHQLRRHCAEYLQAPILGDDLFSSNARRRLGLYLYGKRLQVKHPFLWNEWVVGEIDEPRKFARYRESRARLAKNS